MTDIRYAVRSLLRARWFTVAAVLTFALGIGINVAVFSIVDRVLFRPLPYGEPDRLVLLRVCSAKMECGGAFPSLIAFEARGRLRTISDIAVAAMTGTYRLSSEADDQPLRLHGVSSNLLRVLDVRPVLGRDFNEEDVAEKRRVVIISHETWQRRFREASDVVGRTMGTGPSAFTVVGILPRNFIPPAAAAPDAQWDGLALQTTGWAGIGRDGSIMVPVARLASGASLAAARAEVAGLVEALGPELRGRDGRMPNIQVDLVQGALFSRFSEHAWLITGAAVTLLMLACANLANLLLARGRSREQVAAIHATLGASPRRLVGLALFEGILVCLVGSVVALAMLAITSTSLLSIVPPLFARYAAGVGDMRVLGLAMTAALICAIGAAAAPALRVAQMDVLPLLQRTSPGGRRTRVRGGAILLAIEAALGVTLVLSGLLIVRSFANLSAEDLGFQPQGLYTISLRAPAPTTPLSPEARLAAYKQLVNILRTIPGIRAAAGADSPVAAGFGPMAPLTRDDSVPGARFQVSAGYFETIEAPILAGRAFTEAEVEANAPVAILDVSGVAALFPGEQPRGVIGRPLALPGEPTRTIVGVVPDLKQRHNEDTDASLFLPLGAEPSRYPAAVIRVEAGKMPPLRFIQTRLVETLGRPVIPEAYAMWTWLDAGLQNPRFRAVVFAVLACAALLLAAAGLYAVSSVNVAMRRYEMGVRLTLGARGGDIVRMVLLDACRPIVTGIAVGLAAAYWTEQYLRSFLHSVQPRDPAMYVTVVAILLITALLAAWIPARRAAQVDPFEVLRTE